MLPATVVLLGSALSAGSVGHGTTGVAGAQQLTGPISECYTVTVAVPVGGHQPAVTVCRPI
jgi:hypothetical protein